jgi:ectoine hydroxylase-related dioxygenase (phytanoyl-CoA dioxygenase family)
MPVKYAPQLESSGLRDAAASIACQLLGDSICPEGEHAIMKPAFHGSATHMHQDEAYWGDATDYTSLSVWVPLQPVNLQNGCMHFVAGSHLQGIVPHHSVDSDVTKNGLEVVHPEQFQATPCPLPVGGATVHHCRTIHGAGANSTSEDRFAYIFGFGLPARPASEPRNYYWLREKRLRREERVLAEGLTPTRMRPEL